MSLKKFEKNDIFTNRIKTHPRSYFLLSNDTIYYNHDVVPTISGTKTILHAPQGYLNLYEMNVNRGINDEMIYPFITKQGTLEGFKTVSTEAFQGFSYGQEITGSYPSTASISVDYYAPSSERKRIEALRNTFNYYRTLSPHYAYKTEDWDKGTQEMSLISIPSIFYGSSIKKGSLKLNIYDEGELVATLEDKARNGELVQTLPSNTVNAGKVAGVALYNEGFVAITGSWVISALPVANYLGNGNEQGKWLHWGSGPVTNPVYDIDFLGTNYIPTITMFAHADQGELNNSSNPTFIDFDDRNDNEEEVSLSANRYVEDTELTISNVVKSEHSNASGSFEKITYISKIGIYDEDKNLIGIAKLATPIKKTESRAYTFKMKLDF